MKKLKNRINGRWDLCHSFKFLTSNSIQISKSEFKFKFFFFF